jgi:hypothetical protein
MDVSGMLIRPETPPGASETGPLETLKQNKPAVLLALPDPSDERVAGEAFHLVTVGFCSCKVKSDLIIHFLRTNRSY